MNLQLIRHDTRGSVIVETTLTFPLFILLVFGLIQVGVLFFAQTAMQHAVEIAARCASVDTTNCDTPTKIQNWAVKIATQDKFDPATLTFTATQNVTCGTSGILGNQVSASYPFHLIPGTGPHSVLFLYIFSVTLTAQSCYPA
jgi:Flp pilus assembly protein TadG